MNMLTMIHHELVITNKIRLIHTNLGLVLLGIKYQLIVVIDGPATILY